MRLVTAGCWALVVNCRGRHGVLRKSKGTVVCIFEFFLPRLLSGLLFLQTLLLLVLCLVLVKHVLNGKRGLMRELFILLSLGASTRWFWLWAGNTRFNHRVLCRDSLLWWRGLINLCPTIKHDSNCVLLFWVGVIGLFKCVWHFLSVIQWRLGVILWACVLSSLVFENLDGSMVEVFRKAVFFSQLLTLIEAEIADDFVLFAGQFASNGCAQVLGKV